MKIITNDKMIKRNGRIGNIATFSGILLLAASVYVFFRYPTNGGTSLTILFAGFALSQIGMYFANRWGRHPRPDELLDQGLKGLNDQYSIYHYTSPVAHLLVGPSGLWVLMPYYQIGKIVYEKGRWKQKGGGVLQRYMRLLGQEGVGRPDLDVPSEVRIISKFLHKKLPEKETPDPQVALVFTSEKAELEVDGAPTLTLPLKKLKENIRKAAKDKPISPEMIQEINELFG